LRRGLWAYSSALEDDFFVGLGAASTESDSEALDPVELLVFELELVLSDELLLLLLTESVL
jgi:hypothetical protein